VAVTTRFEVEVGTLKPVSVPQPTIDPANTARSDTDSRRKTLLFLERGSRKPNRIAARLIPRGAGRDHGPGFTSPTTAGIAIVMTAATGEETPGTTLAGEKLAVAPEGKPVTDRLAALVNALEASKDVSCSV